LTAEDMTLKNCDLERIS